MAVVAVVAGMGAYVYGKNNTAHAGSWSNVGTIKLGNVKFDVFSCKTTVAMSYYNQTYVRAYAVASSNYNSFLQYRFGESYNYYKGYSNNVSTNNWNNTVSRQVSMPIYNPKDNKVSYYVSYNNNSSQIPSINTNKLNQCN